MITNKKSNLTCWTSFEWDLDEDFFSESGLSRFAALGPLTSTVGLFAFFPPLELVPNVSFPLVLDWRFFGVTTFVVGGNLGLEFALELLGDGVPLLGLEWPGDLIKKHQKLWSETLINLSFAKGEHCSYSVPKIYQTPSRKNRRLHIRKC